MRHNSGNDQNRPACQIQVGTSGYSYPEWTGAGFYPPGTPASKMLAAYARRFPVTELNYTWYQMPKEPAMERLAEKAPPGFTFTAKLTRTLTHEIDPGNWRRQAELYRHGIAPLVQARRLRAVLIQLPPSFGRTTANRRYLARLLDLLEGLPLAIEFRHRCWAADRVFNELEKRRITLVTVDTPPLDYLFPTLDVVTNPDLFYIRFHGRNLAGWNSGNIQQQFDYLYTSGQLQNWAEGTIARLAAGTRRGVIFFNNHVRGQAPRNAAMLAELLEVNQEWNGPSSI